MGYIHRCVHQNMLKNGTSVLFFRISNPARNVACFNEEPDKLMKKSCNKINKLVKNMKKPKYLKILIE